MSVDIEVLFLIAKSGLFLEQIEAQLEELGFHEDKAGLMKLQQDIGVELGAEENEPAPGPQTAQLLNAYEPVTAERLSILNSIAQKLPESESKQAFVRLIEQLKGEDFLDPDHSAPGAFPTID